MILRNQKGITLIETLLAVTVLIIVLPVLVLSLIRLNKESAYFSVRQRIDSSLSLILTNLSTELISAQSFGVSTSVLEVNPSTFSFVDKNGLTVIIDCPTATVSLSGGDQTIHRLRLRRGTTETVWLTDSDVDVTDWTVQTVRNSGGDLTGLRIQTTLAMNNKNDQPFQNAGSSIDFTLVIPLSVTEL
ncbi:MAG: type II secretion system protein [Candidatus Uhrbacteria bacterium]